MEYAKINKRGMLMRDYVIILILFATVVGMGALIVSDMAGMITIWGVTAIGIFILWNMRR